MDFQDTTHIISRLHSRNDPEGRHVAFTGSRTRISLTEGISALPTSLRTENMHVTTQSLAGSRAKLVIEVDPDVVSKAKVKAAASLSSRLKIPGFRAGKAPEHVIVSQIGERAFMDEVVEEAVQATYAFALRDNRIRPIAKPEKVELLGFEPFKYEVIVPVYPAVELGNYKKVSVTLPAVKVEDKEVEEAIANILKGNAAHATVDRPVQKGDRATIDFSAKDEKGEPVPGTEGHDEPCEVGEGRFIPGFEEELVGMKKGEEKTFPITFPKDYRAKEMAGKKVHFTVKVSRVEEPTIPELNEEFIEKIGGESKTVEAFKQEIRENITKYKLEDERKKAEEKALEKLLSTAKVEVPQVLVDEEKSGMLEDLRSESKRRGTTLEHMLAMEGKTVDKLYEEWEKPARERVSLRFILREIIETEKLAADEAEVETEIDSLLSAYHEDFRSKARELYRPGQPARDSLANRIEVRKVFDMFIHPVA